MDPEQALEAAKEVLGELHNDDTSDIVEYMVGMALESEGSLEEVSEEVGPMIEEIGAEEDKCAGLLQQLLRKIRPDLYGGSGADLPSAQKGPVKLSSTVIISDSNAEYAAASIDMVEAAVVNSNDQALDRTTEVRVKGTRKRSDKAQKVIETNQKLEAELKEARETAARAHATGNAQSIAQLEAGPFDLPNPGGGEPLVERCKMNLVAGRRYGLIGRNGKGKSTMLKWIAARREGANSEAWTNATIHYVTQEVHMSEEDQERLPVDIVMDADIERKMLIEEVAQLESVKDGLSQEESMRLSNIHERMVVIGAEAAHGRATQLLLNLGFSDALLKRPMKALSGGWRVRVALAAALFAKPDILLLDEPTNHLSIEAVLWLQNELVTSSVWGSRIIITVSHDRAFLDAVCTDCMHISGAARCLTQTRGSYTTWSKRRAQDQDSWKRSKEQRAAKRAHLMEFIDGAGTYSNVMKQVNSKKKAVEKLDLEQQEEDEKYAGLKEDAELPLKLEDGGPLDKPAVQIKNASFGYPDTPPLFENVEIGVSADSRMVLLGENGMGKTTLVKLIMGDLEVTKGEIIRDRHARISLVNQHHAEQIDLDETPLHFMMQKFPGDGSYEHEQKLRSHLSGCGINAELQGVPARGLSGGQRSRVAMAAVSFAQPHVLILDEPTNNLDLEAVAALADCIEKFKGAVVVVSHDQYFVGRIAKEVWVVEDQRVTRLESFEAYINKKKASI